MGLVAHGFVVIALNYHHDHLKRIKMRGVCLGQLGANVDYRGIHVTHRDSSVTSEAHFSSLRESAVRS